MNASTRPDPAAIVIHRCLGIESSYRVLASLDGLTQVEAVDVPGLVPGHRLVLTDNAIAAMTPDSTAGDRFAAESRAKQLGVQRLASGEEAELLSGSGMHGA